MSSWREYFSTVPSLPPYPSSCSSCSRISRGSNRNSHGGHSSSSSSLLGIGTSHTVHWLRCPSRLSSLTWEISIQWRIREMTYLCARERYGSRCSSVCASTEDNVVRGSTVDGITNTAPVALVVDAAAEAGEGDAVWPVTETAPGVTAPFTGAFFTGVAAEREKEMRWRREGREDSRRCTSSGLGT